MCIVDLRWRDESKSCLKCQGLFGSLVHLCILGKFWAMSSKLCVLSCWMRYGSRCLIGPLYGVWSIPGHVSLCKWYGVGKTCS
jgi:hypothetical protein